MAEIAKKYGGVPVDFPSVAAELKGTYFDPEGYARWRSSDRAGPWTGAQDPRIQAVHAYWRKETEVAEGVSYGDKVEAFLLLVALPLALYAGLRLVGWALIGFRP